MLTIAVFWGQQWSLICERSGVRGIAVLDGGYAGYKAANQTVAKEFPRYRASQFTLRDNSSVQVSLNEVKQLINQPGVAFLDPRPPKLFRNSTPEPLK